MTQRAQAYFSAKAGEALAIAAAGGLSALIAPPLALMVLAVLAAAVFTQGAPLGGARARIPMIDIAAPIAAAIGVGLTLGLSAGVGMAFVWRVIADTRWSMGEAARLAAISGVSRTRLARAHLWLTPLFGLSMVAYTAPHMVAGLPLDLPHLPFWIPLGCGLAAAAALFDWILRLATEWRLGTLRAAPALHEAAHHAVFLLAYAAAQDISAGLVALIAWRLAHLRCAALPASP
ncbi:MAG: hypothetical protein AB7L65_01935 [Hyphomonadaceae bacterium]